MKLSVVIVNYNVEYFLEQCLLSVEKAIEDVPTEVFVVDNASVDGSCAMVKARFPWVKLIENKDNVGFSRANNQAIRISTGEYVLLLNPDTIVEQDTFLRVVNFMDDHPKAGGLGVRMIDGKGEFLPESKRGLPTPWVAFCKIAGIYRLFRRSKRFNHYYMGYLDEHEVNQVEILSGAFMLMRKKTLDQVGLLDETFFMYGEDIDLSWRIIQGGWENYYFPETRIIHYKGESTKKGSLNYVFVFYKAMVIFARKHFSERNANAFTGLIQLAIWGRAGLALISRFLKRIWLPVMDAAFLFGGLFTLEHYYAIWQDKIYDTDLVIKAFSVYTFVYLLSVFFGGGYDKPTSLLKILKGTVVGSVIILAGYSLLPEEMRFSRALVLLGGVWSAIYYVVSRWVLKWIFPERFSWKNTLAKRFAIIGADDEVHRIQELLAQTVNPKVEVVSVASGAHLEKGQVGSDEQLEEIIRVHNVDEVVFSGKDVSAGRIIELMGRTNGMGVDYKIAPPDTLYMIGSNSIDTSGDLLMLETNGIHRPANRRNKRLFDVVSALLLLLTLPVSILPVSNKGGFISNLFAVLVGRKSWVGYARTAKSSGRLPGMQSGVISPATGKQIEKEELIHKLNVIYARDYKVRKDLGLVWKYYRELGERIE